MSLRDKTIPLAEGHFNLFASETANVSVCPFGRKQFLMERRCRHCKADGASVDTGRLMERPTIPED